MKYKLIIACLAVAASLSLALGNGGTQTHTFSPIFGGIAQSLGEAQQNTSTQTHTFSPVFSGIAQSLGEAQQDTSTQTHTFSPVFSGIAQSLGGGNEGNQPQAPTTDQATTPEQITVPEEATTVYVAGQPLILSSYQIPLANYFWIDLGQGWSQYALIDPNSAIYLIANTPQGGLGEVYELFPDIENQNVYSKNSYNFNPGYNRLKFQSDVVGRHLLAFTLNDQPSNALIIDVKQDGGLVLGKAPIRSIPGNLAS